MTTTTRPIAHAPRLVLSRRVAAVILVLAAVAWLPLNHAVEGPVLYAIDATHGVTTADLASVAMFLLARGLFLSAMAPRRRAHDARTALARA